MSNCHFKVRGKANSFERFRAAAERGASRASNLVSVNWFARWRANPARAPAERANADIAHPNPFGWPVKLIAEGLSAPLRSGARPGRDYFAVCDEAWEALCEAQPTALRLRANARGAALTLNVIAARDGEANGWIIGGEVGDGFLARAAKAIGFGDLSALRVYRLSTRRSIDETLERARKGEAIGAEFLARDAAAFAALKPSDVLLLRANESIAVRSVEPPNEICHFCKSVAELSFPCNCAFTVYCSLDCRRADQTAHSTRCGEARKSAAKRPRFGLRNVGNLCYANAVLQALATVAAVERVDFSALSPFAADFWRSLGGVRGGGASPRALKRCLAAAAERFAGDDQQDAHEALLALLGALADARGDSAAFAARFGGATRTAVRCDGCASESHSAEQFYALSLPVSRKANSPFAEATLTIENCIESFLAPKTLVYRCEKCNQNAATIITRIERAPEILILRLTRFARGESKNAKIVDFGETLNFADRNYALFAVIDHFGERQNGHFKCFAKDGIDWKLCDDERVFGVESVTKSANNYILFYMF